MFQIDTQGVYRAQALAELPWLEHGFGTRTSLDWPGDRPLATVRQIHSDKILIAEGRGCLGEGDSIISNRPGLWLAIRTADCLPILIADPANHAVAAIHAGWRGTVLGIAPKTIQAMHQQFGSRPEDLVVVVGPGIGPCCFEVGPEVAIQFAPLFPERRDLDGRARVDLAETIQRQLRRNAVTLRQVATPELCTACRAGVFHSYRRDREAAGRMVSAIGISG